MKIRPSDASPVSVTTPAKATEPAKPSTAAAAAAQPTTGFSGPGAAGPTDIEGAHHGFVAPHQVESPFSPQEKAALELEKLLYEIRYEVGHRPDWVRIPARDLFSETER